jgi:hypothetical protein
MTSDQQLDILRNGVEEWNKWRAANPKVVPKLSGRDLSRTTNIKLAGANFSGADLNTSDFSYNYLKQVNFENADLRCARLINVNLGGANLRGADLTEANLSRADLYKVDLTGATLTGARLVGASLVETILVKADLSGCSVYGAAVWKAELDQTKQSGLIISPPSDALDQPEPVITIDNIKVAQFVYLLMDNEEFRDVIDTIATKVVLILGRFTPERKAVLDALREELRKRDYVPVLFDFEKPSSKTTIGTVSTLAHMARFVIADITDAKSVLQELQAIVPFNHSLPIQPVILNSQKEPGMFDSFKPYHWFLGTFGYDNHHTLIAAVPEHVIGPAEAKVKELIGQKG